MEHSATCWSSCCYTPYNFQVAVQVNGDSCNNPMVSETKGTFFFKFSPLAWKMVTSALQLTWSSRETDQPVEYVLLQNWEENHLVLSSGLDGGLPVKERDQVRGEDRGTLNSCSITSPWQRGKLSRWACVGSYTTEVDFIFTQRSRSHISWRKYRVSGTKDYEEIPSYQQKSSPKVTAVILPMAFSPACPHKEAFKRSCQQT